LNLEEMMKTSAIAIAALLAVCVTGLAQASTTAARKVVYQQVVPYGDLNLSNEADARILHRRIVSAANKVCGVSAALIPIEIKSRLHACVEDATARAIADVNAPTLTRQGQLTVAANR
jgi:UrcA family protein